MQTFKNTVVSLFDYTGAALEPWARAGYRCLAFDLQHQPNIAGRPAMRREFPDGGVIEFHHWDSDGDMAAATILAAVGFDRVVFLLGFPPCTDLAGSGALHWKDKLAKDPNCQNVAAGRARLCATVADTFRCPYVIENPRGALSRLWRKPDHSFEPCDFGGYLPANDVHPTWPEYIAPRDAYRKATNLWTGNGFVMPAKASVEPEVITVGNKKGSRQWARLGGKSMKTKNIRSATPRGFALAVFHANRPQ